MTKNILPKQPTLQGRRNSSNRLGVFVLLNALLILLAGCGGGGGGGSDAPAGDTVVNGPGSSVNIDSAIADIEEEITENAAEVIAENTDEPEATPDEVVAFNVSTATALVLNSGVIDEVDSVATQVTIAATDENIGETNLLALGSDGKLSLGMNTDFDLNVMYSVLSPDGNSLYLALDNGWGWFESGFSGCASCNYLDYIVEQNCALFKVNLSDNSFSCAVQGVFIQGINDEYRKMVGNEQKPIQFDDSGNLYFLGATFTVENDTFCDVDGGFSDGGTVDLFLPDDAAAIGEAKDCQVVQSLDEFDWNPRLYQHNPDQGNTHLIALTETSTDIDYVLRLPNGNFIFQSTDDSSNSLSLLQGSAVTDLTEGQGWDADFFTATNNDVIFSQAELTGSQNAIHFVSNTDSTPSLTTLDTSVFGLEDQPWGANKPHRVFIGDDNNTYAVIESGRDNTATVDDASDWIPTLNLFQIVPFVSEPIVSLDLEEDQDWYEFMERAAFQVSNGFAYFTTPASNGTAEIIHMTNISSTVDVTAFDPATSSANLTIFHWTLANNILYFVALDQDRDILLSGEIDTLAVSNASSTTAILNAVTVAEAASKFGTSDEIKDIVIIDTSGVTTSFLSDATSTKGRSNAKTVNVVDKNDTNNSSNDTATSSPNPSLFDRLNSVVLSVKEWFN